MTLTWPELQKPTTITITESITGLIFKLDLYFSSFQIGRDQNRRVHHGDGGREYLLPMNELPYF